MKKDKRASSNCKWVARATANQVTAGVRYCAVGQRDAAVVAPATGEGRESEGAQTERNRARGYRNNF